MKCELDCDRCVSLSQILHAFHTSINEEQSWALVFECVLCFRTYFARSPQPLNCYLLTKAEDLYIHFDGFVHKKTIQRSMDLVLDEEHNKRQKCFDRQLAESESKLLQSLGIVVFHALDFGLEEDEERSLSPSLELLIDKLTTACDHNSVTSQRRRRRDHVVDDQHEDDDDAKDEGIDDCQEDITFDHVIQMCVSRLSRESDAEGHYRAVCRALVTETLELSTFLDQIIKGTKELKNSRNRETAETVNDLDSLPVHDWARLWIQVIRELRHGVKLRKVEHLQGGQGGFAHHLEFELTPYEMLLEDIRTKRYKLNKVMIDGHLPPRVKKDAHALILDFIRSRPPLVPVSRRVLGPEPPRHVTLYEKLMQSIREHNNKLRPTTPPVSGGSTPLHSKGLSSVETSRTKLIDNETTPAPTRRLIKADLTLRLSNSFDDDDDVCVDDSKNIQNENVFEDEEPEEESKVPQNSSEEKKTRKFSLRNLSLKLLKSHERRHSITVCESPLSTKRVSVGDLDVNEDVRQHVASIWESTDWGHALECLSLTLQEVQHIRSVLTKAEIETLAVTRSLRDDLENGKICFTCLKTRFSFFGPRSTTCKLCERAICERCSTVMHIPMEDLSFDKVPIYMLSPTPSPPPEMEKKFPPEVSDTKQHKKSLMRALDTFRGQPTTRDRQKGPLVRVCRDCKVLVRHLVDMGSNTHSYNNHN